ncbi:MAG: undecaprenyl/decaprenyl-phosphate alpha-N-acetylglucosaminyl 1-phosphate transferase [Syntrophus sp. (in: bacteria)]|nr:undecaprenyl/decaprenyl-phosphate alpha-N-acetylglucosaminyl 1-phosphate transferase [Syntrophus sp. (in: bacteria)]
MTTILFAFIVAVVLSLVLTPVATWLGVRLGAVDIPTARNVHTRPIPRSGGLAIALAFGLSLIASVLLMTQVSELFVWNQRRAFGLLGGIVVFTVGFFDDFKRLEPRIKFLTQILAASLAYYGGVRIEAFAVDGMGFHFGILSWFITIFWFLLLINAVNLIDGLDGLAAGVAFFTSAVMVILGIMQGNFLAALEFAALAGALLGFLRYNFNPASVFMGDGGSYFIGYTIAALSILGSIKSQVGATLLIPLLALGVPIFDTILSPVRRWVLGQQLFRPDKGHIHHRLVAMGLSSQRAVLIIYGISFTLCALSLLLINLRNEMVSLLLIILGATAFIVVRKMGYLEYLATDKLFGWLQDLSEEVGLSRDRRSFLSLQIEMDHARSMEELWSDICRALEMMRFDRGELHLYGYGESPGGPAVNPGQISFFFGGSPNVDPLPESGYGCRSIRIWTREHLDIRDNTGDDGLLRIEIPIGVGNPTAAKFVLFKNLTLEPAQPYTLRRVEYLRRSVTGAVKRLNPSLENRK